MQFNLVVYSLISFVLSYLILYFLRPKFAKHFLSNPNLRSSHVFPTPTSGGISFVLIYFFVSIIFGKTINLIYLPLSFVGFLDDMFDLNRFFRYLIQVVTACLIIYKSYIFKNYLIDINSFLFILIFVLLIIFITSIINFINFMDGIDGIVSSCLIIVFFSASILINPFLIILVGALLGFLIWNWHPSKIFMGDVGSTFLGAVLAGTLLQQNSYDSFIKVLIIASPLLLDAFICVLRRFIAKEPIFKSHCLHLYQRLYQGGMTHSEVTIIYLLTTFILALLSIFGSLIFMIFGLVCVIIIGYFLDLNYAIPFRIALEKINKI